MQQTGKRIKELRISKNLKQQTIADAIGMSLTAYSNIECGKTENITLERLKQIPAALETDMVTLLNHHNQPNHPIIISLQSELQQAKKELDKANEEIKFLRGGGVTFKIRHDKFVVCEIFKEACFKNKQLYAAFA